MHELGVVFHIADSVEKIAKENDAEHIRKVVLEIGEVSTVIPEYIIDVWNWNCKRTEMLLDCELVVEKINAVTFCQSCEKNYPTVKYGKTCPYCGSDETYLLTGNEVNIKEIEVDQPENP